MKDLKKIANEYGWNGSDVILWMTSPTTLFADEPALSITLTNRRLRRPSGRGAERMTLAGTYGQEADDGQAPHFRPNTQGGAQVIESMLRSRARWCQV